MNSRKIKDETQFFVTRFNNIKLFCQLVIKYSKYLLLISIQTSSVW